MNPINQDRAVEVYREVLPAKYEWTPAKFLSRVRHKITVAREGMTCDAGGVNPRACTFIEVYIAPYVRKARKVIKQAEEK